MEEGPGEVTRVGEAIRGRARGGNVGRNRGRQGPGRQCGEGPREVFRRGAGGGNQGRGRGR